MQKPDCVSQGENEHIKEFRRRSLISCFQDIRFNQIRALLDYMYHGEVYLPEEKIPKKDDH